MTPEEHNLLVCIAKDVAGLKAEVQELKLLKLDVQDIKNYLVEKEQEFYDKISILFDARQINVEKINENTNNIKSIKSILGKHAIRISKLESQIN